MPLDCGLYKGLGRPNCCESEDGEGDIEGGWRDLMFGGGKRSKLLVIVSEFFNPNTWRNRGMKIFGVKMAKQTSTTTKTNHGWV